MKPIFSIILCLFLSACAAGGALHTKDINDYGKLSMPDSGLTGAHRSELETMLTGIGFDVTEPGEASPGTLLVKLQAFQAEGSFRTRLVFFDPEAGEVVFKAEGESQGTDKASFARALAAAGEDVYGAYTGLPFEARGPQADESPVSAAVAEEPEPVQRQSSQAQDVQEPVERPERVERSRRQLVRYFDKAGPRLDSIEGIWTDASDRFTIAFFENTVPAERDFVGIILSDSSDSLDQGDVYYEVKATARPGRYVATRHDPSGGTTGGVLAIAGKHEMTFTAKSGEITSEAEYLRNYPEERKSSGKALGPVSFGTGFMVSKGYLVTNYHVIDDAESISAYFPALGKEYEARMVGMDRRNDLALIRLDAADEELSRFGPIPYRLSNISSPREGQPIFTMGFPLGVDTGKTHKVTTGVISSLTGMNGEPGRMQITSPIQPGSSGGPLFDREGRVVGIVVASVNEKKYFEKQGFMPQNMNFAVKGCHLDALLDLLPERPLEKARIESRPLEELVQDFKPFVAMLEIRKELPPSKAAVAMDDN